MKNVYDILLKAHKRNIKAWEDLNFSEARRIITKLKALFRVVVRDAKSLKIKKIYSRSMAYRFFKI